MNFSPNSNTHTRALTHWQRKRTKQNKLNTVQGKQTNRIAYRKLFNRYYQPKDLLATRFLFPSPHLGFEFNFVWFFVSGQRKPFNMNVVARSAMKWVNVLNLRSVLSLSLGHFKLLCMYYTHFVEREKKHTGNKFPNQKWNMNFKKNTPKLKWI